MKDRSLIGRVGGVSDKCNSKGAKVYLVNNSRLEPVTTGKSRQLVTWLVKRREERQCMLAVWLTFPTLPWPRAQTQRMVPLTMSSHLN